MAPVSNDRLEGVPERTEILSGTQVIAEKIPQIPVSICGKCSGNTENPGAILKHAQNTAKWSDDHKK